MIRSIFFLSSFLLLALFTGLNAPGFAAPFDDNLLVNPGFEDGLNGWTTDVSIASTGSAHSGEAYLKSQGTVTNHTYQMVDLVAAGFSTSEIDSGQYFIKYSGWFITGSTDVAKLEIILEDGEGGEIYTDLGLMRPGGAWTQYEGGIQLVSGTRYVTIKIYAYDNNNWAGYTTDVYTDDVLLSVTADFTPDIWVPDGYSISDNLLTNPGFEANLYSWTTDISQIHTDVPGVAHGGGKYLDSTGTSTNYTYQEIDLLALGFTEAELDSGDMTVYFGGWVSTGTTDEVKIEVIQKLSDESETTLDLGWQKGGAWSLISGGLKMTQGTRFLTFGIYAHDVNNWAGYSTNVWFDDAFLILSDDYTSIINVPGDYATIQSALDNAIAGDTISVADGVYEEHIVWPKTGHITLESVNGPENCILDGTETGRVILFSNNESPATLQGFTIKNGLENQGAGIYCDYASPTITGNIFEDNTTTGNHGAAINCMFASPVITNNLFQNNVSGQYGGAIHCGYDAAAMISENTFINNSAQEGGGIDAWGAPAGLVISRNVFKENQASSLGGAIVIWGGGAVTLENNLLVNNQAPQGTGIYLYNSSSKITNCTLTNTQTVNTAIHGYNSSPVIQNCIVWPEPVVFYNGGSPQVITSNIQGDYGSGSFFRNPRFVSDTDYHLDKYSCCIDKGTTEGAPELDLEGNPRPQGKKVDMGCYETERTLVPIVGVLMMLLQ